MKVVKNDPPLVLNKSDIPLAESTVLTRTVFLIYLPRQLCASPLLCYNLSLAHLIHILFTRKSQTFFSMKRISQAGVLNKQMEKNSRHVRKYKYHCYDKVEDKRPKTQRDFWTQMPVRDYSDFIQNIFTNVN